MKEEKTYNSNHTIRLEQRFQSRNKLHSEKFNGFSTTGEHIMNNVIKFLDAFLHEIGRVGNSINELGIDLSREGKVFHGKFVDHRVDFYNRCVNSMGVKGERGGAYSQSAVFIIMCQLMVLEMGKE